MLVFAIQVIIFGLVAADVIDLANKGNPFNLPANVESTVRMTEVLAIVIAIITQDDVRTSINLLRDGYDKEALSVFPGSTKAKWVISIFLRGSEGILGLFVTFLLVMQSSTVLDLLLNFSAMEFVSLIDDVVFGLTTEGFFGRAMKKEAKFVSHSKYYIFKVNIGNHCRVFHCTLGNYADWVGFHLQQAIIRCIPLQSDTCAV